MRRFLTGTALVVWGIGCGYALAKLAIPLQHNDSFFFFLMGFGLYAVLWIFFLHRRDAFWSILEHEITHAVIAFMFRKQVRSLNARRARGGSVHLDGGNLIIALAPYFLPLPALVLAFLMPLVQHSYIQYFALALGFLYGFHFFPLLKELHFSQPDIRNSGILFSFISILAGNMFFLGIVLASLYGDWKQFWLFIYQSLIFTVDIVKNFGQFLYRRFVTEQFQNTFGT